MGVREWLAKLRGSRALVFGAATFAGPSLAGPSLVITFPTSEVYTVSMMNLSRGLVGSSMARVPIGFTQGAVNFAVDFAQTVDGVDIGADCTTWNSTFSGYTRGQALLTAGTKTGAEVAAAFVTAAQLLGVSGITRDGAVVTIRNATNGITGATFPLAEDQRGMWGRQRADFGGAPSTAPTFVALNETVSEHVTAPASAGRIIGVGVLSTSGARTGLPRLGVASGPAYSTSPAAFSAGVEGEAVRNGNLYLLRLAEPVAMGSAEHKWMTLRANTAAGFSLEARPHGSTPVGNGDLTVGEALLRDNSVSDPATPIFASGAYTPAVSSTLNSYGAMFIVYELPDVDGVYYGDGGSLNTWIGDHDPIANGGTPSTNGPTVVDGIMDSLRLPLPAEWTGCRMVEVRQAVANMGALEDIGGAVYNWTGISVSTYPAPTPPPLLGTIGRFFASSGGGYKNRILSTPIDLTGVTMFSISFVLGNVSGVIPATTVTTYFNPPGVPVAWLLSGFGENGRRWSDLLVERGGNGVNSQYVQSSGTAPLGAPAGSFPSPLDTEPGDASFSNHPKRAARITRAGLTIVAA